VVSELSDTVRAIFAEARKTQEREPRCGISDAHGCVRAKVYSFLLFKEEGRPAEFERPARWGLAAACGTAVGQLIEEASERLGHKTQVRVESGRISGSADIVLIGEHVIDVKVAGGWKWRKIQHEPDPEHRRQVATYATLLEKPKWALLYIDGRSIFTAGEDVEWVLHEGLASVEHYKSTSDFWASVHGHLDAGTLPGRLEPDSFECKICPHAGRCWEL
jgi:hypothetical protein